MPLADQFLTTCDDAAVRYQRLDLLEDLNQWTRLVEELKVLLAQDPEAVDLRLRRARAWSCLGHLGQAQADLDYVLRTNPKDPRAVSEMGIALSRAGKSQEALPWLRRALQLDPANGLAREWLIQVDDQLGLSSKALRPVDLPPAPMPGVEAALTEAARNPLPSEHAGARIVGLAQAWSQDSQQRWTATRRTVVEVLNPAGAARWSTVIRAYDPRREQIAVHHAQVLDAAGTVLAEADPDRFYVLDARPAGLATEDRNLHIPIPGLRPGVRLDVMTSVRSLDPCEQIPFTLVMAEDSEPVACWQASPHRLEGGGLGIGHPTSLRHPA